MWSLFGKGNSTVTCWFCNEKTRLPRSSFDRDTKNNWHCNVCENQNILDHHGDIVDSLPEMYCESPIAPRAHLPEYDTPFNSPHSFCPSCQRNQEMVCKLLSAYLPDESDPEYEERFRNADEYTESLKRRYPVVCQQCQIKVDQKLQQQAQWLYRRELASALHRSQSARKFAPQIPPQPTLRRKRLVAMWVLCALVFLAACPLCVWGLYVGLLSGKVRPSGYWAGTALLLAFATHVSRMINPLWLYIAFNPGVRAAGLLKYKKRVTRLALLRGVAAILQVPGWHPAFWCLVLGCDLVLYARSMGCLYTQNSRRPASRINRPVGSQTAGSGRTTNALDTMSEQTEQQTLTSLAGLSFGASEANLDQNDSFVNTAFSSATDNSFGQQPFSTAIRRNRQKYRSNIDSSDEENATIGGDILADLNTLSFGTSSSSQPPSNSLDDELASLLGGSQKPQSSMLKRAQATGATLQAPRPFEPYVFKRSLDTGLESKMSAFSLDDGSYQGLFGSSAMDNRLLLVFQRLLSPGAAIGVCVIGSWVLSMYVPLAGFWIIRLALLSLVVALLYGRSAKPLYGYVVAALLVALPMYITLGNTYVEDVSVMVAQPLYLGQPRSNVRWQRWPRFRQTVSEILSYNTMEWTVNKDTVLLIYIDIATEISSLIYMALA
ncbi:hypothetical protein EV183_000588 [Coemansia sp. RSA 2336]|nr:hypothetical protein EV183_000588 [Coemansia sp. RSA 2336]